MGCTDETLVLRVTYGETGRGKIQKVYLPDFMVYVRYLLLVLLEVFQSFLAKVLQGKLF